jgi:hypothetical protein
MLRLIRISSTYSFVSILDHESVSAPGISTADSLLFWRVCGFRCPRIWRPRFCQDHLAVLLFSLPFFFFLTRASLSHSMNVSSERSSGILCSTTAMAKSTSKCVRISVTLITTSLSLDRALLIWCMHSLMVREM